MLSRGIGNFVDFTSTVATTESTTKQPLAEKAKIDISIVEKKLDIRRGGPGCLVSSTIELIGILATTKIEIVKLAANPSQSTQTP